jgi:glycosyltransferase involved in cell wall biosynthesis
MGGLTGLRPQVGVLYSWIDPRDPLVWSGIPSHLLSALERLDIPYTECDVTPPRRLVGVAGRVRARFGRPRLMLQMAPEVRLLTRLSDTRRRLRHEHPVDGWIALSFALSSHRPVRGKVASLTDVSPAQVHEMNRVAPGSDWLALMTTHDWKLHTNQLAHMHRSAYACCVASHWTARSMVGDHGVDPARVHVVGLGHDVAGVQRARDWSVPRFVFVGRDWERKNGEAVVRAFARLRNDYPSARIDIVGRHPVLDLEGVTAHGELARHDRSQRAVMDHLFEQATCFIMPSLIEPFGIAYLEAAAYGVPSIATSRGGTEDSVGPGGILVEPGDDQAILRAMRDMCDPTVAARLGSIARQRSELFTWDAVAGRVLRALDLAETVPGLADFL